MKEQKIAICHSDRLYAERSAKYINRRKQGASAVAFAESELLVEYLSRYHTDILLCEENISEKTTLQRLCPKIIWLSAENVSVPEKNIVPAYTSVNNILETAFSGVKETLPDTGERMVAIFSVCDDGRTTEHALKLAEHNALRKKILFISMSPLYRAVPDNTTNSVSDLLFMLSGKGEIKLSDYVVKVADYDTISGFASWIDADELSPEDAERLADCLEKSEYQRIFIDLGSAHAYSATLMKRCDKLVLLKNNTAVEESRLKEFKKQLCFTGFGELAERLEET